MFPVFDHGTSGTYGGGSRQVFGGPGAASELPIPFEAGTKYDCEKAHSR